MRQKADTINPTAFTRIHARGLDTEGRIAPRCGSGRTSKRRDDIVVSGDWSRVDCPLCESMKGLES